MTGRCKGVHTWRCVGRELVCRDCPRRIDVTSIEPWRRRSILESVGRCRGVMAAVALALFIERAQHAGEES